MLRRKLTLVTVAVFMLTLLLSACGAGGASSSGSASSTAASSSVSASTQASTAAKTYKIGVVLMALNSDYWHTVEAGAINAGKELGADVTVVGPNAESDVTGQIAMVEDMLAKKVDAIVLSRNDPQALVAVCKKATDAGIPVVTIDGDIADTSCRKCFIGTENYDAAKEAANYIAGQVPAGSEVAIIRGLAGAPTHDKRQDGCKDVLISKGYKVVSIQPADSERAKAVGVAENILQAHPNVKAIYATNDEMALGAYQAVSSMGKNIVIVGFDGSSDALKSIIAGKLSATVAQMPVQEGYQGVQACINLLKGETVEDHIKLPIKVVTKDIAEQFQTDLNAEIAKSKN